MVTGLDRVLYPGRGRRAERDRLREIAWANPRPRHPHLAGTPRRGPGRGPATTPTDREGGPA